MAGQGGKLFARGLGDTGTLTAKWGNRKTEVCSFSYQLPVKHSKGDVYTRVESTCDNAAASHNAAATDAREGTDDSIDTVGAKLPPGNGSH